VILHLQKIRRSMGGHDRRGRREGKELLSKMLSNSSSLYGCERYSFEADVIAGVLGGA